MKHTINLNAQFWKKIPDDFLSSNLAKNIGIDLCPDLESIKYFFNFDDDKESLMEVGFGEGRVIDFFLRNGFQGKIYGVDSHLKFFKKMSDKYRAFSNVSLFLNSILSSKIELKVTHSMMLWSLFYELPLRSKMIALRNMSRMTEKYVFLDAISAGSFSNINWIDKNTLYKKFDHGEYFGHIPDQEELYVIFQKAGLCVDKIIPYECKHQSKREIYVLKKMKC